MKNAVAAPVLVRRTDHSGNAPALDAPAPPRALFSTDDPDRQEVLRQQAAAQQDAAERERSGRFWRGVKTTFLAAGWGFAFLGFATAAVVHMRQTDHHWFTVFNEDKTVSVYATSWDLQESKRENLTLSTAAQYVRACIGYNYADADVDHQYCGGMSTGPRRAEWADQTRYSNKEAPQNIFGVYGWRRAKTGTPFRTASNAITVPAIVIAAKQGETPVCVRRIYRLTYVPVRDLPSSIHRQYPTADIMFIGMAPDQDPNPLDAAACKL